MEKQSSISRRMLLAASAAAAVGTVANSVNASSEPGKLLDGEKQDDSSNVMRITFQLTNGTTITHNVAEMVAKLRGDLLFTPTQRAGSLTPNPLDESMDFKVTLDDGRVITLTATDIVIDHGTSGQLHIGSNRFVIPIRADKPVKEFLYDGNTPRRKEFPVEPIPNRPPSKIFKKK